VVLRLAVDIRLATHCDPEAPSRRREHTDRTIHRLVIERSHTDPRGPLTGPTRGARRLGMSGMSTSRRWTVRDPSAPKWATSSSCVVPNRPPAATSPIGRDIDRWKYPYAIHSGSMHGAPTRFFRSRSDSAAEGGQAGVQEGHSATSGRSSVSSGDHRSRAEGSEVAGRQRARPGRLQADFTPIYAE
jgi:hypothetical protein